jgi:GT2 family glycosyltransferase
MNLRKHLIYKKMNKVEKIYFRRCNNDVSIIVLSYNNINVTKDFIETLYRNTSHNLFNLIMIDNGSSDGTVNFLKDYLKNIDNSVLISNSENLGVILGRNQGYDILKELEFTSKYVMFLDNDQFVQPNWLEHHLSVLNHGYDLISVEAWQLNRNFLPVAHIKNINQYFNYVGCGGMIMRKEVPEKIGMFDEQFNPCYFEDPDFNFRSYDAGFKIGWNVKAKIVHLPHQTLGKLNQQEKIKKFTESLNKFKLKWKGRNSPVFRQVNLPEFD